MTLIAIIMFFPYKTKTTNLIEKINPSMLEDISIVINADILEKKSKLRSKFEKDKNYICIALYPDNQQTLVKLSFNFITSLNSFLFKFIKLVFKISRYLLSFSISMFVKISLLILLTIFTSDALIKVIWKKNIIKKKIIFFVDIY